MKNKRVFSAGLIVLIFVFVITATNISLVNSYAISTGNTLSNNEASGYFVKNDKLALGRVERFQITDIPDVEFKLTEKVERYNEYANYIKETYAIIKKNNIIGYLFYDTYSFNNGDLYYYLKYDPESINSGAITLTVPYIFKEYDLRAIDYPEGLDQTKSVIKLYEGQNLDSNLLTEIDPGSVYVSSDSLNGFFSYSSIYEKGTHNIRKELYEKAENIQITDEGIKITLPADNNSFSEQWGIISKEKLVDWEDEAVVDAVKVGDLSRVRKWGGDGQYYFLPYGYAPYSSNGFYRNSANHIGNKYISLEGRLFDDYAYITIDTLTKTQNSDGFWGTDQMAVGLYDNYGVGAGFFDTRWDTEAALSLLKGYRKYNEPQFLKAAIEYADFYCDFAVNNAYITKNEGLLVYDYGFSAVPGIKTHVSLNHLVSEMNFLLEMYSSTAKYKYLQVANRILKAIADTAEDWVNKETGDLFYGYYGNGKYDVTDYPTLTLNDLRYAQVLINTLYTREDSNIKMLIETKENYLTKEGIAY